MADTDISVQVLRADGTLRRSRDGRRPGHADRARSRFRAGAARGATITGSAPFTDGQSHLYAATVLRPAGAAGPRAVVLSLPDRSRAAAIADLVRTLPLVVLVERDRRAAAGPAPVALGRRPAAPAGRGDRRPARPVGARSAAARGPERGPRAHRPVQRHGRRADRRPPARDRAAGRPPARPADAAHGDRRVCRGPRRRDGRRPRRRAGGPHDRRGGGAPGTAGRRARGGRAAPPGRRRTPAGAARRRRDRAASTAARFESAAVAAGDRAGGRRRAIRPPARGRRPGADSLAFVADRGAVERIMANLVNNALAATPSGGHVWLSATAGPSARPGQRPTSVVLAVTDDGPGLPTGQPRHASSSASTAPTRRGPDRAAVSASPSSASWRPRTAEPPMPRTSRHTAPGSASCCRTVPRSSLRLRGSPATRVSRSAGLPDDRDRLPGGRIGGPDAARPLGRPDGDPGRPRPPRPRPRRSARAPATSRRAGRTRASRPVASQNDDSVGTPVGTIRAPSHRPGDQAADVGGVVDRTAGGEAEREVDHDQDADLADERAGSGGRPGDAGVRRPAACRTARRSRRTRRPPARRRRTRSCPSSPRRPGRGRRAGIVPGRTSARRSVPPGTARTC